MGEEHETYGDYSVDDEDQPSGEDTLSGDVTEGRLADELDQGYATADHYSPDYGNTAWEAEHGETLEMRIRQEVTEPDPYAEDDWSEEDDDHEVGDRRAGRLVDPDGGFGEDSEKDLVGFDVGVDGAGASAEEAAVHIVPDEEWEET